MHARGVHTLAPHLLIRIRLPRREQLNVRVDTGDRQHRERRVRADAIHDLLVARNAQRPPARFRVPDEEAAAITTCQLGVHPMVGGCGGT